ncbi:MAG: hypothetical protein A2Y11_03485 [Planctomycetes bacterium GWC2_39_26]|nr:MAG: hypothetical protein A2Y11_03485 [Planctomycetes bacterium GWC2_39_26]
MKLSDIKEIKKNPMGKGYLIIFNDGRSVLMHKRRTIPALLTLIRHGEGCENDLTNTTTNLKEIKKELEGKIPSNLIQDSYSDANKPFSELWNEEGFTFIENPVGEKRQGSQKYILEEKDHEKLFIAHKKAERKLPPQNATGEILVKQKGKCNLCGALLRQRKDIKSKTYAKDRVRLVWDHRVPVEKGGNSGGNNFQALCFYCNKCKWQICNFCKDGPENCLNCVLAHPESTVIIYPTKEDIADRLNREFLKKKAQ